MAKKSNEDFQKDVLEILKQHGENLEGFKKEVRGELAKKQPEIGQKEQITDKDSDYSYMTTFGISSKIILSEEETKIRVKEIAKEMATLMKKYQISKLECFVVKNYG